MDNIPSIYKYVNCHFEIIYTNKIQNAIQT